MLSVSDHRRQLQWRGATQPDAYGQQGADSNAAPDNAPPAGIEKRACTQGHRNMQRIAFHPQTKTPIVAEHGPWHSYEITVLVNGGNLQAQSCRSSEKFAS
ncbi:MAG: PQQ-dependent sugar dehydrogenase [Roseinatronobacter sp.]|nr:PQQ-dependent sugar dehydrogenase [Roseinatronobacter sp.]